MKSILVMGGSTFVSSSLAKYLIQQEYNVDILTRGMKEIDYTGYREHLVCDRKSKEDLQEVLKGRNYDIIFDISAYTKLDVEILLTSLDTSGLSKYIFCSSGAVYKSSNMPVEETFEKDGNPNWGKYGIDKMEAENFIIDSGIPYIIFRPTYIYGENNNLYREGYFFDSIRHNKVIPMPFGNNIQTQFIHIDDLVRVFESVIENKHVNKAYNVTNPEVITWEILIEKCGEVVGKSVIIKKIDVKEIEARSYFPFRDITNTQAIIQLIKDGLYVPEIYLKDGLKQTYEWYSCKKPNVNDIKMMDGINEIIKI